MSLPGQVHCADTQANAIDEGKASYAQLMVKILVDASVAEGLAEDVRATGTSPTIKKV